MEGTVKQRRKFTPEYRREAAHLVIDTGRTVTVVAAEIKVSEQLLGKRVRAEKAAMGGPAGVPALTEGERAELERLRAENQQLRLDNEFLGKAAAYFASRKPSRFLHVNRQSWLICLLKNATSNWMRPRVLLTAKSGGSTFPRV